jgi:AmmeMemoRadiSam system protein B
MSDEHLSIRPAAVAGLFYSDDPDQLRADILHHLKGASRNLDTPPKAIIAPHAGYVYSGPVAASAYALLEPLAQTIKHVILLGPSHRLAFRGIATPDADIFATPLGQVKINRQLCQAAEQFEFVQPIPAAHAQEHSLEVQLPFLQTLLADFDLTPLVVGDCPASDVARLLDSLWGGDDTLIVISSDLSHYHNYEVARRLDASTSQAIEQMQPENISYDDACGRAPLNGLLTLAKQKHLQINTLDLRNSGDTAGSRDRVVGYGAYAVH